MSDVVLFPDIAIGYSTYTIAVMKEKMTAIADREMATGNEIPEGIYHSAINFFSEIIAILDRGYPQSHEIMYCRTLPILRRVMAKILNVQAEIIDDSAMLPWLRTARVIVTKANNQYTFKAEEIQILQALPQFFHDLEVYGQRDLDSRRYASWDSDDGDD